MDIGFIRRVFEKRRKLSEMADKMFVLDYLKGKRFRRILDAGCCVGEFTMEMARTVGAEEVLGIDIDDASVEIARSKGVKAMKLDLNYALPFEDDSFDLVLSIQNIEHLYFTDACLREMHRILKRDGTFFIGSANLAALHYRIFLLFGIQPLCLHPSVYQTFPLSGENPLYGHKSVFTYGALKQVLEKHHFKVIKSYTHTVSFLPAWLSKLVCRCFNLGTFSHYIAKKI